MLVWQVPIVLVLVLLYIRTEILLREMMHGTSSMSLDEFWCGATARSLAPSPQRSTMRHLRYHRRVRHLSYDELWYRARGPCLTSN